MVQVPPPGHRSILGDDFPALETPGYYQLSLRDNDAPALEAEHDSLQIRKQLLDSCRNFFFRRFFGRVVGLDVIVQNIDKLRDDAIAF